MVDKAAPVISQHIKEGWRYPETPDDPHGLKTLPVPKGPILYFKSRVGKVRTQSINFHKRQRSLARFAPDLRRLTEPISRDPSSTSPLPVHPSAATFIAH
jgi:hypothetical protein